MGNEEVVQYKSAAQQVGYFGNDQCIKANRLINLFLQLPEEIETEVVRGFEAEFVALAEHNPNDPIQTVTESEAGQAGSVVGKTGQTGAGGMPQSLKLNTQTSVDEEQKSKKEALNDGSVAKHVNSAQSKLNSIFKAPEDRVSSATKQ